MIRLFGILAESCAHQKPSCKMLAKENSDIEQPILVPGNLGSAIFASASHSLLIVEDISLKKTNL